MYLRRPILSEKSAMGMDQGLYVFEVSPTATKQAIRDEVKKLWNVEVVSVRMLRLPAKEVRFRRKAGQRAERHRAYIQLKEKQRLPGFELPKQKEEKK